MLFNLLCVHIVGKRLKSVIVGQLIAGASSAALPPRIAEEQVPFMYNLELSVGDRFKSLCFVVCAGELGVRRERRRREGVVVDTLDEVSHHSHSLELRYGFAIHVLYYLSFLFFSLFHSPPLLSLPLPSPPLSAPSLLTSHLPPSLSSLFPLPPFPYSLLSLPLRPPFFPLTHLVGGAQCL